MLAPLSHFCGTHIRRILREALSVYRLDKRNRVVGNSSGELTKADWVQPLPVPEDRGSGGCLPPVLLRFL